MLSWIEFGALLLFTLFAVRMLCKFSVMHTGVDPTSERYMRTDALYHKTMRNRTLVWGVFAVVARLTKTVATQLRTTVKFIFVGIGDTLGGGTIEPIAEQIIPWFGTVVVAAALAFMAVSLHYFGTLKSDTEIKYGSD
jgi:hypothetical protein